MERSVHHLVIVITLCRVAMGECLLEAGEDQAEETNARRDHSPTRSSTSTP